VSDEDLELLENYLDGALPPGEAERVSRRLALDPVWARALEQLRAERAVRHEAWRSMEPDAETADAAGRAAVDNALHADRWARASRLARRASAVAAGLLIAFAGGWVARGRAPAPAAPTSPPVEIQVALTDEGGRIIAVQHFSDPRRAREFAEDVGRWQSGRRQQEQPGDFSQVSDEF
jgi:anti-sigma factor RsiW